MRVVQQGEAFAVQSQKSENGQVFQDILLTDFYKLNWFEISVISSTDSKRASQECGYSGWGGR